MRGQTVRLDGLEPTVTDFAGSYIFLLILSLRGKAEFQGWPAIPNSPETVGTNGIGGLGRSFAGSQFSRSATIDSIAGVY